MNRRCKHFRKKPYFSGNAHLQKYNICGWLICGEWKLADVVVKEEGDYLVADLKLSDTTEYQIGKYGRMRQCFLKENHGSIYSYMILSETLWRHLAEIDEECNEKMNSIICASCYGAVKGEQSSPIALKMPMAVL